MTGVSYASAVEAPMYVMICTRSDIAKAVEVISRFMANPGGEYLNGVKRILKYIKGTSGETLCFGGSKFLAKVDSDFTGDPDKRKSTISYVFH